MKWQDSDQTKYSKKTPLPEFDKYVKNQNQ